MKWIMLEIEGRKREHVNPCVVTLDDGELPEDVAVAIAKASIQTSKPGGLGLPAGIIQEGELIPEDVIKSYKEFVVRKGKIILDYYAGRPVKLNLSVINPSTLSISLNYWTDRLPLKFAPRGIPQEAIDDMENILQIASGQKEMPQPTSEDEILDSLFLKLGMPLLFNKGKNVESKEDILSAQELKDRLLPGLRFLSRNRGRFWPSYGDLKIGVAKEEFFFCSLRNEQMGISQQEREFNSPTRILCAGCGRANAMCRKQPMCVGHMIRLAWEKNTTKKRGV